MRNVARLTVLAFLVASLGTRAAEDQPQPVSPEEAKMCPDPQRPCQKNVHIVLKQQDGATFDRVFPIFQSIVQDGFFTVVPGQTVNVEADIVQGKLVPRRAVDVVTDPARTITAKFEQKDDGSMWL